MTTMSNQKTTNEIFNLRGITNPKWKLSETIDKMKKLPWVFDTWYDKLIILILLAWAFYSVYRLIFSGGYLY